jgi:hypothetical protein
MTMSVAMVGGIIDTDVSKRSSTIFTVLALSFTVSLIKIGIVA